MLSDTSARPWLSKYPEGVLADVDTSAYHSLVDLLDSNFQKYSDRTCVSFLGKPISYQTIDHASIALATYFQGLGLVMDEAKRNGARLPVTALVDQFYADLQQLGGNRWDTSSLIKRIR